MSKKSCHVIKEVDGGIGIRGPIAVAAISIKQPWANLIASGVKTIETRRWKSNYRGRLFIAASASPRVPPYGCLVAVADLANVRRMKRADESRACVSYDPKLWAFELENIVPLTNPIPIKGARRIFLVTIQVEDLR